MAYTVEDIFKRSCSLVDSLTDTGDVDSATTSDYRGRTLTLTDMALKDLMIVADFYKQYDIARFPTKSMLGLGFETYEYLADEDRTFECNNDSYGEVKTYYFESDSGDGTVYIEDYDGSWNTLATVTLSNTGIGFNAYRGAVTGTTGATKTRVRCSGSYHYKIQNIGLFNHPFESGKEPVYRAWVGVSLPSDLKSIDKITTDYPKGNYEADSLYRIERENNGQTLYVNYDFKGELRIQYKPITTVPTAFTDSIELDDVTATAICYYLAMNFVATEQNDALVSLFNRQYENLKFSLSRKQPTGEVAMTNVYGGV